MCSCQGRSRMQLLGRSDPLVHPHWCDSIRVVGMADSGMLYVPNSYATQDAKPFWPSPHVHHKQYQFSFADRWAHAGQGLWRASSSQSTGWQACAAVRAGAEGSHLEIQRAGCAWCGGTVWPCGCVVPVLLLGCLNLPDHAGICPVYTTSGTIVWQTDEHVQVSQTGSRACCGDLSAQSMLTPPHAAPT